VTDNEKPYWWPEQFDADKVRTEIQNDEWSEDAKEWLGLDDEDLQEVAVEGKKYLTTWDHVGDAYRDYEPLADAFLKMVEKHGWEE